MIISASRRTDIPAFFSAWFLDKIRLSYCTVTNPFNPRQVKRVSLKREDVDLFVFWTKNPGPFIKNLVELDERGYSCYFLFTLTPYSEKIEPGLDQVKKRLEVFRELSKTIGGERVIWRYDPLIISEEMDFSYHLEKFRWLAGALKGATSRAIISLYSPYRSADKRLKKAGIIPVDLGKVMDERRAFLKEVSKVGVNNGMDVTGCAQENLQGTGVSPGKCIDDRYIENTFGLKFTEKKDTGQRPGCGCIPSQDIGFYDTCLHGCLYCYAWRTRNRVEGNFPKHRTDSPSLLG